MVKNLTQAEKYIAELKRPPLDAENLEIDEEGHKIYYGGLTRIKELIKRVGNPDRKLKIIQVVGTAGKGTVSNVLSKLLETKNFKVGLFTSPHITSDLERVSINGKLISEEELIFYINYFHPHLKYLKKHLKQGYISPFELFTAIALRYFADQKVDYVILEAGCGGKYDSTSAVEKTELSILTSIGEDHTEILGAPEQIAKDKASIIQKSEILLANPGEYLNEVKSIVSKYNGRLILPDDKTYQELFKIYKSIYPEPIIMDMLLAYQAFFLLGFNIPLVNFPEFKMPARFEKILDKPKVYIDGAHNEMKMKTVLEYLQINKIDQVILVFSAFKDKKYDLMLKILKPYVKILYLTSMDKRGRVSPPLAEFKAIAQDIFDKVEINYEESNIRAFSKAKKIAVKEDLPILVTGSFDLVGKIRELYWTKEKVIYLRKII